MQINKMIVVADLRQSFQKANGRDSSVKIGHDKLLMTPHARRLSQQSSNEDVDWPSNELVQTQTRCVTRVC